MHRVFSLAVAVAVALALAGAVGAVTAQENASNDTEPETNETAAPATGAEVGQEGTPIDEDVTLTSWEYAGGTFTLTFENDARRPVSVTISEATQPGEGSQQFAIRDERLLPGETTVTMPTRTNGGAAAVTIVTSESRAAGRGVVVSTGQQGGEDPFAPFGGTSGVFSGVGLSIVMSGGAAGWVLWREESGVVRA